MGRGRAQRQTTSRQSDRTHGCLTDSKKAGVGDALARVAEKAGLGPGFDPLHATGETVFRRVLEPTSVPFAPRSGMMNRHRSRIATRTLIVAADTSQRMIRAWLPLPWIAKIQPIFKV